MSDLSYFESRIGKLSACTEEVFSFVTDVRNFERVIPPGIIANWQADRESCSFSVSTLGTVGFRMVEKDINKNVVYKGDALRKNDFSIVLHLTENDNNKTDVKVSLSADLNPIMKMMAAKPIEQFLGMLINEMEKFNGWKTKD